MRGLAFGFALWASAALPQGLGAAGAGSETGSGASWSALRMLERDGARVSAAVQDLADPSIGQSLNASTRLTPASITKLVVAASALEVWAADKTFETRVMAAGPVRKDGRVEGDLLLHGDGDATFDHRDLWQLAGQVRAAGIRSVEGGIVANPAFGPLGCDNVDRCDALSRSDTAYNVPLAALAVDYGTWCVEVTPSRTGEPARLRACGGTALPLPVEGSINTGGARSRSTLWIARHTVEGHDLLKVGGAIPPGDPQQVARAMSDPALGTAQLLRQMLVELGIEVHGPPSVRHGPPTTASSVIGRVQGLALREQLGRMLRYSNNYVADLLTLNLAAARASRPPMQLAEASALLAGQLVPTATTNLPRLYSGSGLTPENEISAAEMITMLEAQYRKPATFPVFYGGLVVPGQAPFAFLRGGSRAWQERVALKTGTMNDPHSVCAVAGYLRRKDGGWMAFSIIVNGSERRRHVPLFKAMEAIRADIGALLERY